ncbi:alpha/beta hydrolase family protein [Avibacterium gallinarum]|uniref:alpha/beta hydrolase family protein n=1 Tax=Avibacterium gallinarum TaxID=755 RepID=UPI003BF7B8F9
MHKVLHFLGRDFTYYEQFTREKLPLLFIFHGAGYNKSPAKFKDERFNVVSLMDTFGFGGKGSWYLGQDGDIFWIDALKFLLEKLKNDYQTDTVYFWGSSMGGYAALLHGYINKVTAVYEMFHKLIY